MKLLFDQNLSRRLVSMLVDDFPDSSHVAMVGLDAAADREVWEYAKTHGFAVVSKDADFAQLAFLYGPPPKVIWLRVGNQATRPIGELLRRMASMMAEFAADAAESVLVLPNLDRGPERS